MKIAAEVAIEDIEKNYANLKREGNNDKKLLYIAFGGELDSCNSTFRNRD